MSTRTTDSSSSARHKTALAFIDVFSTFSMTDCLSLRTPNCMHHFAPHSIAHAPRSNQDFVTHLTKLTYLMASFPVTVKEMIDNPASNQVLIWANASPVWLPGVTGIVEKGEGKVEEEGGMEDDWAYTGEYMFLLSFEDGESGEDREGGKLKRIERVVEFVDSKGTMRLFDLMQKAKENLERQKEQNKVDV